MGTFLNIISRLTALLKKRVSKPPVPDAHAVMLKTVIRAENAIYNSIVTQLENDPEIPKTGREVRLLYRRLAQYRHLRNHASLPDQDKALKELAKQWRKVERLSIHKDHSEIRRPRMEAVPAGQTGCHEIAIVYMV